jgi:hypothetical protein
MLVDPALERAATEGFGSLHHTRLAQLAMYQCILGVDAY